MLRVAQRGRVHERLGYGSFVEYIERLFGYSPRLTLEKLRVAEALETLPELAKALRSGSATWSSLRELTRVATPETELQWLEAARGRTMRDIERLVSGHRQGDRPGTVKDWRVERHFLRFEVTGEVLATFREAMASLRRDAGGALDDDAALLLMARRVLAGPADDGRAGYQLAITVCEACAKATQTGAGELVAISPEIAAMAHCDGQILEATDARAGIGERPHQLPIRRANQTIPPAVRREVLVRDHHRCQVPGCRHATFVDVHHLRAREDGGGHEPGNLLTLCSAHHRACHRGDLLIGRLASGELNFRHPDGTTYGEAPCAGDADVMAHAFRALRNLGFGERETRGALEQARAHVGIGPLEGLIRSALEQLTNDSFAKAS